MKYKLFVQASIVVLILSCVQGKYLIFCIITLSSCQHDSFCHESPSAKGQQLKRQVSNKCQIELWALI